MKFLFIVLSLLSTAFASEIPVVEMSERDLRNVSAVFEVNKDLGRAWVTVKITEPRRRDEPRRQETHRTLVEGLAFDAARGVITLDHEGQLIECATAVERGRFIFRHTKITNTNCSFRSQIVTKEYDTGFEIIKKKRLQVFLVVKE